MATYPYTYPTAPTVLVPKPSKPPRTEVISQLNCCLNLIIQSNQVERVIKPCLPMLRDFLDGNRFKRKRNSCIMHHQENTSRSLLE